MRKNLTAIALGLLAAAGCAHERPNRKNTDGFPYSSRCYPACTTAKPNDRPAPGAAPRAVPGTVNFAPPPIVTVPAPNSPGKLLPFNTAPRLPDPAPPADAPVLPTPTTREKRLPAPVNGTTANATTAKAERSVPPPVNRDMPVQTASSRVPEIEPQHIAPRAIPPTPLPAAPTQAAAAQPPPAQSATAKSPETSQTQQVLTGTVESWRKMQRLRYAPVDEEEANGGLVILVGDPQLGRVKDGQRIRVHGFLIPSTDRTHPPTFQVQSVEAVK